MKSLLIFLAGLLWFLLALNCQAAELTSVSGKLTVGVEKTPVAEVQVLAYPVDNLHLRGEAPYQSNLTAEDGLFRLKLPVGTYYFIAVGEELYSFYGRNPVTVVAEGIEGMNLSLVDRHPASPEVEPRVATGIFGQLSFNGEPLAGAIVTIYTDLNTQLKGMGLGMTAPTDEEGVFEAPLQPGTYYLVARKRNSGAFQGPLQAGDFFGYYPANPLLIREGEVARVSMAMVEVPEKVSRLADEIFGDTSISGRVVDLQGEPVAGVRVLLYTDSMMLNRPLYVSQPSAADGQFILSFPQGGVYFLSARNNLGGPPAPGELYGRYQQTRDSSIRLEDGQKLTDIRIQVEPVE